MRRFEQRLTDQWTKDFSSLCLYFLVEDPELKLNSKKNSYVIRPFSTPLFKQTTIGPLIKFHLISFWLLDCRYSATIISNIYAKCRSLSSFILFCTELAFDWSYAAERLPDSTQVHRLKKKRLYDKSFLQSC